MALAMAMEMNRIFIPTSNRDSKNDWHTPSSICNGIKDLTCYFQTWTNCTWDHVEHAAKKSLNSIKHIDMGTNYYITGKKIPEFKISDENKLKYLKNPYGAIPSDAVNTYQYDAVITIFPGVHTETFKHIISHQFDTLLQYIPINQHFKYYWWRAVSTSFLYRPNEKTSRWIESKKIKEIDDLNGKCVSMYIRHGDKGFVLFLL